MSIRYAARSVSRRAWSISTRDSAICARIVALLGEGLAERDAGLHARAHQLQRAFGHADQPHAVVNPAGPEPSLRDLEPAALAEQHVRRGNPHVVEHDLGVAVRGIVEPEHRQHPLDADAGRIHRYQDHRLLLMSWRGGIAAAHEDRHAAARVAGPGDPPLASVDDVLAGFPH